MERYPFKAPPHSAPNQSGFIRSLVIFGVLLLLIMGIFNTYRSVVAHANSAMPEIRSLAADYCIDDHHDDSGTNVPVTAWPCNDTLAQNWSVAGNTISHAAGGCLSVKNNGTSSGDPVVLNPCDGSSGQVWQVYLSGYENPRSGMCLSLPDGKTGAQLVMATCNNIADISEGWAAVKWSDPNSGGTNCSIGTKGQRIACNAIAQWNVWQSRRQPHAALLNAYTDGNSYEAWCADFVSYVYKTAGYPFQGGERDGWDEYDANQIQYLGFTRHDVGSYIPKAGDVAYFDYSGGHVEIVVVGGRNPTFIYGNSGTTDPVTGNGEMNEDMLTSDGSAGQVVYYLSPN